MKKITCSLLFVLFAFTSFVLAQSSGACSYHGGVDCGRSDFSDGSVVCNDGWRDSKVMYDDVKKCTVDSTCPIFEDSKTYEQVAMVWKNEIERMRKVQSDYCKSVYEQRITYANQLEASCKTLDEQKRISTLRGGAREYVPQDCSQQKNKEQSLSTYNSCLGAVDVYDGILKAKKQLSCLEYIPKIITIMDASCKKTNSKWNNYTRKCDVVYSDSTAHNNFAEMLGKSLKSFNSTQN